MALDRKIDPADPPPLTIDSAPEVMLAAINTLTNQLATSQAEKAALRADIAHRDAEAAKADAWKVPKAAASLSDTPKPTIYRWIKQGYVKCRTNASGKVEIYMESVFDCIRQLGRRPE